MADSPWPTIHGERRALADDLAQLSDAQWATPSQCSGWSVHDLLGHMLATAKMTPPKFLGGMLSSGFNFNKMVDKDVRGQTAGGPAATLADFRSHIEDSTKPPGPIDAMLGEALIHSEDIRKPLGIKHEYPTDSVVRVLDFYKNSNLVVGAKKRVAGLSLQATDASWSNGSGPTVSGPAHSLLMAMTGRASAVDDLEGDGVETLRSRCT
jgi:uncharacterized protein (TIGR03083 family)